MRSKKIFLHSETREIRRQIIDKICQLPFFGGRKGYFLIYRDLSGKMPDIAHTEVTAYGASCFLHLHKIYRRPEFLDIAAKAADFVMGMQSLTGSSAGGFRFGKYSDSQKISDEVFSFDVGISIRALSGMYRATKNEKYLKSAVIAAEWIIGKAQDKDGSFRAAFDLAKGEFIDKYNNSFYGDHCALNSKLAVSLLDIFSLTGNRKYEDAAIKVLDWAAGLQKKDGYLAVGEGRDRVYFHPLCYAGEAFAFSCRSLENGHYRQVFLGIADYLRRQFLRYGFLPWNLPEPGLKPYLRFFLAKEVNAGVLAQAGRLWLLAYEISGDKKYYAAVAQAAETLVFWMKKYPQVTTFTKTPFCFKESPVVYVWAWMFVLQFLDWCDYGADSASIF